MKWADCLSLLSKQESKQTYERTNKQSQNNNKKNPTSSLPHQTHQKPTNQINSQDAVHILGEILPNKLFLLSIIP